MTTRNDSPLLDRLADWLEVDSTSGREADFLTLLERHLEAMGLECSRQPVEENRWNLLASGRPNPTLLFSTHVDTVPPQLPVRRDGDTIYGRGACDTKGGLLAMIEAGRRLLEAGLDDVGYLLVVGEEVDHRGAKEARSLDLAPERIILCEPTRNRVVSGQKGMLRLELSAEGRAAHSAFPDAGTSAIHRLLSTLERIRSRNWPSDDLLGETTTNVGIIEGGVAANVLAPSARAELLLRTVSPAGDLLEAVREQCSPGVDVNPIAYNDPVTFDPPPDVDTTVVPFNTDATYLGKLGPIWLVGPGDIRTAHSDDEHIHLGDIRTGIDLYEDLARRVLE